MKVAFIGLGNMGGGMAANQAKAGHAVSAFDLSAAALDRAKSKRRTYSFADAGVQMGDVLTYSRDGQYTAKVVGPKKIEFEGATTSLSKAALMLLHREGYTWQTVNGWNFWTLGDETIAERLDRLEQERAEADEG
jgi:3-hydroxyisobutyrate dehydrogenase-like beta-hydroxyacid dehydrogenase